MVSDSGSVAPARAPGVGTGAVGRAHSVSVLGELLVLSSSQSSSGEWRSRVLPTPGPACIDGLGSVGGTACIEHSDLVS
jgi:hypothetical protein